MEVVPLPQRPSALGRATSSRGKLLWRELDEPAYGVTCRRREASPSGLAIPPGRQKRERQYSDGRGEEYHEGGEPEDEREGDECAYEQNDSSC